MKKNIISFSQFFAKINFPPFTVPLVLLLLILIAYGVFVRTFGFYWDDWPPFLVARQFGMDGFWDFYRYDRPLSAWTFVVMIPLLGRSPLAWQLTTLGLRWLTAVSMWWGFGQLWPAYRRQVTAAAVLFAVYPIFTQQNVSVAYSQHWLDYALFMFSIAAMIYSIKCRKLTWLFRGLSYLTMILQLSITEYFIGVELLRPLLLWLAVEPEQGRPWARIRKTILLWLPYLVVMVGFIIWRLNFIQLAQADPNRPYLLYRLFRRPLQTIFVDFMPLILKDFMNILVTNWYTTFEPSLLDNVQAFTLATFITGAVVIGLVAFYLHRLKGSEDTPAPASPTSWAPQGIIVGVAGLLLGALPGWLIGVNSMIDMDFANRYALPSMFGASILIVALVDWLGRAWLPKALLISVLVGLAVGADLRNANAYHWRWVEQERLYWQIAWRAPQIEPQTPILIERTIFPAEGTHSTLTGINMLYPQPENHQLTPYWLIRLGADEFTCIPGLIEGEEITNGFRNIQFSGDSRNALVMVYNKEVSSCMWIVNPDDRVDPDLPRLTKNVTGISNLDRIINSPPQGDYPPSDIFGPEPSQDNWCYIYQKADLARQFGDWEAVVALSEKAEELGFQPLQGQSGARHEWLPFIEGYANTGRWDDALALSQLLLDRTVSYSERLCGAWRAIDRTASPSDEKEAAMNSFFEAVGCSRVLTPKEEARQQELDPALQAKCDEGSEDQAEQ